MYWEEGGGGGGGGVILDCASFCLVATIGTNQPSYTVNEFEDLSFDVSVLKVHYHGNPNFAG